MILTTGISKHLLIISKTQCSHVEKPSMYLNVNYEDLEQSIKSYSAPLSPKVIEEIVKGQYSAFLAVAAKVAAVHDAIEKKANKYDEFRSKYGTDRGGFAHGGNGRDSRFGKGGRFVQFNFRELTNLNAIAQQLQPQPMQTQTAAAGFGAAPTASTFQFGASKPATGLFGAPAATSAPSFGFGATATSQAATGMFGAPAVTAAPSFGFGAAATSQPASGMFGAPAATAAPSFGFGAPAPTQQPPGLFGAPTTTQATLGGLFGTPAAAPSFGFGAATSQAAAPSFGFGAPAAAQPSAIPAFGFGAAAGGKRGFGF